MEAAFFDLDKTVISRSSLMAFAPALCRAGLLQRRTLVRAGGHHLVYQVWGAGPRRVARLQRAVLGVTAGWERDAVRRLVADGLESCIDPIVHVEARAAIAAHRAAGRPVVLVSAAPEELAEPIGTRLGVDKVIASRAAIDEQGRYAGHMERYAYGPAKAVLITEFARRQGIDLTRSWAYSDSSTDLPMLEAVGHPVAVNPDRALRRVAQMRSWEIAHFAIEADERTHRAGTAAVPALAVTAGGLTAWWLLKRDPRTP